MSQVIWCCGFGQPVHCNKRNNPDDHNKLHASLCHRCMRRETPVHSHSPAPIQQAAHKPSICCNSLTSLPIGPLTTTQRSCLLRAQHGGVEA